MEYQDLQNYQQTVPRGKSKAFILFYRIICVIFKLVPKQMSKTRNCYYRLFGAKIGRGSIISPTAKLYYPWNIEIGSYCWIGDECNLYSIGKIIIGSNVALAHKVDLYAASHAINDIKFPTLAGSIVIEDEVWIASNVSVGMNTLIERGCVVGLGSVVFGRLNSGYVYAGNPAIKLRKRRKL